MSSGGVLFHVQKMDIKFQNHNWIMVYLSGVIPDNDSVYSIWYGR